MNENAPKTFNVKPLGRRLMYFRFVWHSLLLLLSKKNRTIRKQKGVSPGDALFNFFKLTLLERTMLKYRHMVKFGQSLVVDSTFPPYPSPAFDKRLSNYLNNIDLMELPTGIVSLSITHACPYACSFCSTDSHRNGDNDLDEELLKKTIRQIEDLGTASVILHGGEPMFRYDKFLRLVKHVRPDTCLWMFTTGYGVTPERALELKQNGLFGAWVSLDHYDADFHNRLRGNPEAFQNACSAVENFKKAGVYTCLSMMPPEDLLDPDRFKRFYDFAKELGVAEIRVMESKPSGRNACKGVVPHSPVLEQLQKDLFKDPAFRDYPPFSGLSTWLEKDPAFGCQCRFEYLFITADGDVQPCEVSEFSFGNIAREEFPVIYRRICQAFPRPSTGCIPMLMFPEVRQYHKVKDTLSDEEKSSFSAGIMKGFLAKGKVPGVFQPVWSIYERRVERYRKRKAASQAGESPRQTGF
jgi:MoaA/NifB/PqqE/SkfB family radical SAM enzyme